MEMREFQRVKAEKQYISICKLEKSFVDKAELRWGRRDCYGGEEFQEAILVVQENNDKGLN